MKLALKIGLPLLAAVLVLWLAVQRFRTSVPVAVAAEGAAVEAVTGTVKVFANMDLNVKTEVNGRVVDVPVAQGDNIKKGAVMVRLESLDLEQALEQRRIQLDAARARLWLPYVSQADVTNLEEDLARLKQQAEYGGASQADLDRRQRDLDRSRAALENERITRSEQSALLEAQVRQLEAQIDRMRIRAPFDGKIVTQMVFPGDYLWAGNQVGRLVSPGRWIELTLAEEDFYGVAPGQKATLRLASYPGEAIQASVSWLSPTADAATKTRTAILSVDAPDEKMIPGLTGEAVLVKAERAGAVIIPRRALIGNRVYVVDDGRIDIRQVRPGFLSLNKAEILDGGVKVGEQVVLEGQSLLRDGQSVEAVPQEE